MGRKHDAKMGDQAAERARAAFRDYVRGHRDTFGGAWFEGDGVTRRYVVSFVGDLAPHQAALADLLPGLEFRAARYPEAELQALVDPVMDFAEAFDAECFSSAGVDPEQSAVELEVITSDELALRAALAERFGDRVRLEVIATDQWSPAEQGFDGWLIDPAGRELTVTWLGGAGERNAVLELTETPDEVRARVRMEQFNGIVAAVGISAEAKAMLREPLGDRRVIDAVAGEVRSPGRRYGPH